MSSRAGHGQGGEADVHSLTSPAGLTDDACAVCFAIMQRAQATQIKPFLSPADVAEELGVSSSTVLRMIHSGQLPAILVSERIYRIPGASFERYKAGELRTPGVAPEGSLKPRPRLAAGESLPKGTDALVARR
jgi:excisionase family DNA binding protein